MFNMPMDPLLNGGVGRHWVRQMPFFIDRHRFIFERDIILFLCNRCPLFHSDAFF
jgi:hypothetical protein